MAVSQDEVPAVSCHPVAVIFEPKGGAVVVDDCSLGVAYPHCDCGAKECLMEADGSDVKWLVHADCASGGFLTVLEDHYLGPEVGRGPIWEIFFNERLVSQHEAGVVANRSGGAFRNHEGVFTPSCHVPQHPGTEDDDEPEVVRKGAVLPVPVPISVDRES